MTVTCPSCHASLTVPDDRLPAGKVVQARCPRCKGSIQIDASPLPRAEPPAASPAAPVQAPAPSPPPAYGEQRQPRALVCVDPPDERARVLSTLREAGYQAYAAADPSDAMERLRFTPHAAAVIRDGFGGAGDRSPLMDSLAEMGMALRRTLCVVLVSDVTPALDPMVAFAHSVDLVIHPKDLAHLSDALQRCQENAERKYGVLQQALRAAGKA